MCEIGGNTLYRNILHGGIRHFSFLESDEKIDMTVTPGDTTYVGLA